MSIRRNITDVAAPAAGGLRASILKERQLVWPRIVATAAAALMLAAVASWLRLPVAGPARPMAAPPRSGAEGSAMPALIIKARGAGDSPAVREQVALLDPTPLFLPTAMSSAQAAPAGITGGDAAAGFGDEPARIFFTDTARQAAVLPPLNVPPGQPSAWPRLLLSGDWYQGIGRRDDAEGGALPRRLGAVSVARMSDGRVVARFELTGDRGGLPPEPSDAPPPGVTEFMLKVEEDGLVGPFRVITSSGSTERDDYLSRYLSKTAWIGTRLPPGGYIVTVGP